MPAILHLLRLPWKMALHSLLWGAAVELPLGQGPGRRSRLTQASPEVPGFLWISLFPQRKNVLRRVQCRQVAHEVRSSALASILARCGGHWATPPPPPTGRRSGTRRRDRRSRIGVSDISLPLARWKRLVMEPGCKRRRNRGAGKDYRLRSLRHPGLRSAKDQVVLLLAGSARRAGSLSPLACSCCRSPPSTWTSRMSLTTLCGRCFAISNSTGHSTSWWLDRRLPQSRLLSGTCSTSMGSRRLLLEYAGWTRPKSSACASPICWWSEPQRRGSPLAGRKRSAHIRNTL